MTATPVFYAYGCGVGGGYCVDILYMTATYVLNVICMVVVVLVIIIIF